MECDTTTPFRPPHLSGRVSRNRPSTLCLTNSTAMRHERKQGHSWAGPATSSLHGRHAKTTLSSNIALARGHNGETALITTKPLSAHFLTPSRFHSWCCWWCCWWCMTSHACSHIDQGGHLQNAQEAAERLRQAITTRISNEHTGPRNGSRQT